MPSAKSPKERTTETARWTLEPGTHQPSQCGHFLGQPQIPQNPVFPLWEQAIYN